MLERWCYSQLFGHGAGVVDPTAGVEASGGAGSAREGAFCVVVVSTVCVHSMCRLNMDVKVYGVGGGGVIVVSQIRCI